MALKKEIEIDNGCTGDYSKIAHIKVSKTQTDVVVELYKDQAAKEAGKPPIKTDSYVFKGANTLCTIEAMDEENPLKIAYDYLKTLITFSGSEDA